MQIRISKETHKKLKIYAVENDKNIIEITEKAISEYLKNHKKEEVRDQL